METFTVQSSKILVVVECGACGTVFAMSSAKYKDCKEDGQVWYCPNGHSRVFREPDVKVLERQLREANSKLSQTQFELLTERKAHDTTRQKAETVRKRVGKGVCPCCNRQFIQLTRHMQSKHPEYAA